MKKTITSLAIVAIVAAVAMIVATTSIVSSSAFADKGEANNHISDQGRANESWNGAIHSGVLSNCWGC